MGLIMWLLTREVLRLRGELPRSQEWKVLPDLFFHRDAADEQKIQDEIDGGGEEYVPAESSAEGAQPAAAMPANAAEKEWDDPNRAAWGI